MLKVSDLRVGFGSREVVKGISFEVNKGEVVGIIGESGSGKSVSALGIAGLLKNDAWCKGKICFNGKDLNCLSDADRMKLKGSEISMIFQEPLSSLNPVMKIGRQVSEPLAIHRPDLSRKERLEAAVFAMERAGLENPRSILDKYPHQLSGGMRQRVMIAMSLICSPSLLIADEPTTALDVTLQGQILKLLRSIVSQGEMGCLFISHNMSLVENFCDRVYVMHDGVFAESGSPRQIFLSPSDPYTKNLISSIPDGKKRTDRIVSGDVVLSVKDFHAYYREPRKNIFSGRVMREVVKGVSFDVRRGEMVGLVGRSGCGKSTLSKGILGLLPDTSGDVRMFVDGESFDVRLGGSVRAQQLQMVFQDPYGSLNPSMRVGRILKEPLIISGKKMSDEKRRSMVCEALKDVGLDEEIYDRYPAALSGGQRQRVCIALALIQGAKFVVADEPVSALDVTVQKQILELLKELSLKKGISCLFISHDMAVVRQMCHRIFIMHDGKLTEVSDGTEMVDGGTGAGK